MIVTIFKFIHIATISIWVAGLFVLPFLMFQRRSLFGDRLHNLQSFTRFFYVSIVSPAGLLAVVSGTALIFLLNVFEYWFTLKLGFVVALSVIHIAAGAAILKVFEAQGKYSNFRLVIMTSLTILAAGAIILTVLLKPDIKSFFPDYFAPGALAAMLSPLISWMKS